MPSEWKPNEQEFGTPVQAAWQDSGSLRESDREVEIRRRLSR